MKIISNKLYLIYIFLFIGFFMLLINSSITAAELTASEYEINLDLDHPHEITSNSVNITPTNFDENISINNNIYLESFTLKNKEGREIAPEYIKIETPYFKNTMDRSYRFLLMKEDQEKSWFKIGLAAKTAYLDPGIYEGFINIDGLDWEIEVNVSIKPFVKLYLEERNINFAINNPQETDFFIAPDLYALNIDYNHTDWEVQLSLENEFANEKGKIIPAEDLFYRLEDLNQNNDLSSLNKEQFESFKQDLMITLINGRDYQNGLTAIRFGVNLARDNSSVQSAGLYSGNIFFTLKILDNNL